MSDINIAKKMARAIVSVVKQNNKLVFYNAESNTIPAKIINLEGLKTVDIVPNPDLRIHRCYEANFKYDLIDHKNSTHVTFPCEGSTAKYNHTSKQYDAIKHSWEAETVEIIQNMTKLI
jgi:hypothetical protein